MFPPFAELAGMVALGCALILVFIAAVASAENKREKKSKATKETVYRATVGPKKATLPAKRIEIKSPAFAVAETFPEPTRSEFAKPFAGEIAGLWDSRDKLDLKSELALHNAISHIHNDAVGVLQDFAKLPCVGPEKRLSVRRIIKSCTSVLKSYNEYRDWAVGSKTEIDERVIANVVSEFEAAAASIAAFRVNHQKDALNSLTVELHVLRDVTRR